MIEIKDQFDSLFEKLGTLKVEIWMRKLKSEWNNFLKNEEIHPIGKWIFWVMHVWSWILLGSRFGLNQQKEGLGVSSSIAKLCEKNGIIISPEKNKLLANEVARIHRKEKKNLDKLVHTFGQIYREEGTRPLAVVCATPIRETRLGQDVFRLKYGLEKDLVETVLSSPQISIDKRQLYKAKLDEKMASLTEKEKEVQPMTVLSAFIDVLPTEQLEREVCNWVKSKIL